MPCTLPGTHKHRTRYKGINHTMETKKLERIVLLTALSILSIGLLSIILWGVPEEIIL